MPKDQVPFLANSAPVLAHKELYHLVKLIEDDVRIQAKSVDTLRRALTKRTGVVLTLAGEPVEVVLERTRPFIENDDLVGAWHILAPLGKYHEIPVGIGPVAFDVDLPGDTVETDD